MSKPNRPHIQDFVELGSKLAKDLKEPDFSKELYKELKALESRKSPRNIYPEKKIIVQLYCPERGDIFIGTIRLRENPDSISERFDANVIMQNYVHKHDTKIDTEEEPIFFSTEDYDNAEMKGQLRYHFELARVLHKPRIKYFVHRIESG